MHLIAIMVTIAVGCTKKTTWTETDNMPTPQDSIKDDENQIDKKDIFIKNHPLLKNTPFYSTTINDIKENFPEPLDVTFSEESADGHFIYYQGDGIIYITDSNGWLYSVILTKDKYEFGCGLKVGMEESKISDLDIPFHTCKKDEIGVNKKVYTFLLSFEIGPVSMFDFDTLYYYSAALQDENEPEDGHCLGIMAFMKDGELVAVFTDWPNAN